MYHRPRCHQNHQHQPTTAIGGLPGTFCVHTARPRSACIRIRSPSRRQGCFRAFCRSCPRLHRFPRRPLHVVRLRLLWTPRLRHDLRPPSYRSRFEAPHAHVRRRAYRGHRSLRSPGPRVCFGTQNHGYPLPWPVIAAALHRPTPSGPTTQPPPPPSALLGPALSLP